MERRLGPISFLARFVYRNRLWWLGFYCGCCCRVLEREKHYSRTLYFSLIIVKSLQLRGRRQIAEPRKYCLVRVIVFFFFFFWRLFSLFYFLFFWFLTGWEFGLILYKLYKYTLGIIVPTFWDWIIKPKAQNNQQHFS